MRYRLHLGWKGTKYLGWQRLNGLKDKSVQARLEVRIIKFKVYFKITIKFVFRMLQR